MRVASAFVVLLLASFPNTLHADGSSAAWKKFKGQVIVSDAPIRTEYESDKEMVEGLTKARRDTLTRPKGADAWEVHFVGFLAKKPGGAGLSVVLYDGKRQFLTAKEIAVDASAEILASSIEIGEDDGVKPGSRIEIVLGRKSGGKETVFAKTKVTLK